YPLTLFSSTTHSDCDVRLRSTRAARRRNASHARCRRTVRPEEPRPAACTTRCRSKRLGIVLRHGHGAIAERPRRPGRGGFFLGVAVTTGSRGTTLRALDRILGARQQKLRQVRWLPA